MSSLPFFFDLRFIRYILYCKNIVNSGYGVLVFNDVAKHHNLEGHTAMRTENLYCYIMARSFWSLFFHSGLKLIAT
jgi:hypothetical protein